MNIKPITTYAIMLTTLAVYPLWSMEKPTSPLTQAAAAQAIKTALDNGTYVEIYRDAQPSDILPLRIGLNDQDTPVMYAIDRGQPFTKREVTDKDRNAIALLLAQGFDVNAQGALGDTALHRALRMENKPTVEMLLARGASAAITNGSGNTALKLAQTYDIPLPSMINAIKNPPAPRSTRAMQAPAMSSAAAIGSWQTKSPAIPRAAAPASPSPLLRGTTIQPTAPGSEGKLDFATKELAQVIDKALKDYDTALLRVLAQMPPARKILMDKMNPTNKIQVYKGGKLNNITSLLGTMIDHGYADPYEHTTAAQRSAISFLIELGTYKILEIPDLRGNTVLIQAIRAKDIPLIKLLLAAGSCIYIRNKDGMTAIKFGQLPEINLDLEKLEKDANVLKKMEKIKNALERDNQEDAAKSIKLFMMFNDIDAQDDTVGETLLLYAIKFGREETIRQLLELGANPQVVAFNGKTAFDYAQEHGVPLRTIIEHIQQKPKAPEVSTPKPLIVQKLLTMPTTPQSQRAGMVVPKNVSLEKVLERFVTSADMDLTSLSPDQLIGLSLALARESARRSSRNSNQAPVPMQASISRLLGSIDPLRLSNLQNMLNEELRRSNIQIPMLDTGSSDAYVMPMVDARRSRRTPAEAAADLAEPDMPAIPTESASAPDLKEKGPAVPANIYTIGSPNDDSYPNTRGPLRIGGARRGVQKPAEAASDPNQQ